MKDNSEWDSRFTRSFWRQLVKTLKMKRTYQQQFICKLTLNQNDPSDHYKKWFRVTLVTLKELGIAISLVLNLHKIIRQTSPKRWSILSRTWAKSSLYQRYLTSWGKSNTSRSDGKLLWWHQVRHQNPKTSYERKESKSGRERRQERKVTRLQKRS